MKKLFSMDSPLMEGLSAAADLLVLNLLTVLLSLPLITIGPAMAALHTIVLRMVRREDCYLMKPYFKAFAANFRKGALLSLVLLLAIALLAADYLAALATVPALGVGILALGVLVLAAALYAFPLLARYETTLGATLKNAIALAVAYFPRTLFMVVCALAFWILCIHFYKIGVPLLILFGFSLPCYVDMVLMDRVFRDLDGESGKAETDTEGDDHAQ